MHSGRWAEAAHLFRPNFALNLKMLSSARRRAGARLDSICGYRRWKRRIPKSKHALEATRQQ
eukprot:2366167-Prymnesium_polylepis.1